MNDSKELSNFFAVEESIAAQVAVIVGQSSAAAQALEKLQQLRNSGRDAVVFRANKKWVVSERNVVLGLIGIV